MKASKVSAFEGFVGFHEAVGCTATVEVAKWLLKATACFLALLRSISDKDPMR
jgi:hypothetical protein